MARRSPLNQRYQKDAKLGSTRKSAAAAKPKRSSEGGGATTKTSGKAKGGSAGRGGAARRIELPPEIKSLQKFTFVLLGVAVALSALYLWQGKNWGTWGGIVLGAAYVMMFTALYFDFARIRPAIKAARGQSSGDRGKKPPPKSASSTESKSAGKHKD